MTDYSSLANSQSAYDTSVIDSLPVSPFMWRTRPEAPVEVIEKPATSKQVRPYSKRFKTVEAYENHKASARAYDKRKRDEATMKRNALRVNLFSDVGTAKQKQASDDKSRAIQASSYRYRTVR